MVRRSKRRWGRSSEVVQRKAAVEATSRAKGIGESGLDVDAAAVERLRMKMWQARGSHSRLTGLAMLVVSGAFLSFAFLTNYTLFEMVALVSFVMGVFLIATELEPRVKLLPSAEGLVGPLLALSSGLAAHGFEGTAVYVPQEGGVVMRFKKQGEAGSSAMPPVGHGLAVALEREIGPLADAKFSYVSNWVPKAVEKGLGLADRVTIDYKDGRVDATLKRPYVRTLCGNEGFNKQVCCRFGCPLVGSLGEILAASSGTEVAYQGCIYEHRSQTSTATFKMENKR
ncbi:MAG: hypothetical protein JRM96_03540 [Nitrososphaerota archaeon]|jgi:hypothetical protein|nr:hypothetical protein [Nitrososphaerota archaeon]MDG6952503.1 hypothetical protein [Nitrososphaerota archaeon]